MRLNGGYFLSRQVLRAMALVFAVSLAGAVHAGNSLDPAIAMASACSSCHSAHSVSSDAEGPGSLAALTANEIEQALLAFRSGERVGTLMNRLARGYSDDEITAMARVLTKQ